MNGEMTIEADPGRTPRSDEMESELACLRAENARLRGLLGLDERAARPASAWTPTLFPINGQPTRPGAAVANDSPLTEKVALYLLNVRRQRGRICARMEQWANWQVGMESCGQGSVVQRPGRPA